MVIFLISVTGTPSLAASCEMARLWSRRVRALNRSAGMSGALLIAMSALVLAGLPVTRTLMSSAATSLSALPWAVKIAPLAEQVAALHAGGARAGADEQGEVHAVEDLVGVVADLDALLSSGNAQSSSSMTTPSSAFRAGVISSRRSSTGWSGPSSAPLAMRNSRL
jgi:hypothetical protein